MGGDSRPKPMDDPSEADDRSEFLKLSSDLFGDGSGVHNVGQGTVYSGQNLGEVLAALHVKPDFDYAKDGKDSDVEFVHRKLTDGDIYFVDNRSDRGLLIEATFRVTGKQPELWHAETGTSEPVSFEIADGRTTVPLRLEPWGTVFVVFDKRTAATSRVITPSRRQSWRP